VSAEQREGSRAGIFGISPEVRRFNHAFALLTSLMTTVAEDEELNQIGNGKYL
jgi:hypothetical protein